MTTLVIEEPQFRFPGFVLIEAREDRDYHVEIGTIMRGKTPFVIEVFRHCELQHLSFLLRAVRGQDGQSIWNFKSENYNGIGLLAMAGDDPVIVLATRGKGSTLERVIPFSSFGSHTKFDVRQMIDVKKKAAAFLSIPYELSGIEKKFIELSARRIHDANREADRKRRAEHQKREAERAERVKRILSRDQVSGFTVDGRERYGYPVLKDEWPSLPRGTSVILVDSFDEDTYTPGKPLEAFEIDKRDGQAPAKKFLVNVSSNRPGTVQTAKSMPMTVGTALVEMDGKVFEVKLFASMADIRQARAAGLNGGAFVAVNPVNDASSLEVYEVHEASMTTVGKFPQFV
jgi:hypothetical protein